MIGDVPISVGQVSGWGAFVILTFIIVRAYTTGRIWSDSAVATMLKEANARVLAEKERADTWQAAWQKQHDANELRDSAERNTMLEAARTMVSAIESVQNDHAARLRSGEETT